MTAVLTLAAVLLGLTWNPEGVERPIVVVVGNSVARGCCVPPEERWPRGVAAAVEARPVVVARDGASSSDIVEVERHWPDGQERTQLDHAVARLERAGEVRAIVLAAGINDIFFLHDPAIGESCLWADTITCRVKVGQVRDEIISNLDRLVRELTAAKPGVPLVLLTYVVEDCDVELNAVIRDTADRHGAVLVDACEALAGELDTVLADDGLHLSSAGQTALAELILDAIGLD